MLLLRPQCPLRHLSSRRQFHPRPRHQLKRTLLTLAIESSCDDTAVAVLSHSHSHSHSHPHPPPSTRLLFNERISSDNRAFKGVHPVVTVQGHNSSLAPLVQRALEHLPDALPSSTAPSIRVRVPRVSGGEGVALKQRPDFVSVTRGPGIMANLAVGLNMAKGLAVAWDVPLVGVHHMQAHALTPRLVNALKSGGSDMFNSNNSNSGSINNSSSGINSGSINNSSSGINGGSIPSTRTPQPAFPFLSLLVSGGHTQLVHSSALTQHSIVATTGDIAIGNLLDQTARVILPPSVLGASPDVMYGRALESFAFPSSSASASASAAASPPDYSFFSPATSRADEISPLPTGHAWTIPLPLRNTRRLAYSFSSIHTHVHRIAAANPAMEVPERRHLAMHTMRAAFQHLASRLVLALEDRPELRPAARTLVVAGGVASNKFLMHVLRETLRARGYPDVHILAPPVEFCTDNAAMIAWTGMEMFMEGWCSDWGILPVGKWPMEMELDLADGDGDGDGILGVGGWVKRRGYE